VKISRKHYPNNWPQIRQAVLDRDGHRCRHCGAVKGQPHPVSKSQVVITVAHVANKENTMDCRLENLITLCMRCHLKFDTAQRMKNALATIARKKGAK
jgi:5-methylcytosine-specific restriction endonuclease McrA